MSVSSSMKVSIMLTALVLMVACATVQEEAAPQAQPDAAAAAWLEKIEAKAGEVKSLSAQVVYIREQGLLGDKQVRLGTLVYQAGPPAKFEAHFDALIVDSAKHEMDVTYVFDGRYLVERDNDERIWSRWELAREGEQADLLALGEGPFSLPLNMKKDAVLARFDVAVGEADEDGKLVDLVLTPKVAMDVTRVELWFDRETLLPVRARQEEDDDATDVKLRELVMNPEQIAATFDTAAPDGANWQVNDHPMETPEPAASE